MRGPAKKPQGLRVIDGTTDRPGQLTSPMPRNALPECPEGVSDTVRTIFDETVRELQAMKTAHAADRDTLLVFCEWVAVHRRAAALLAHTDVLVRTPVGAPRRNPALTVMRDAAMLIKSYANEFGLTPVARRRIEVGAGSADGAGDDNLFAGLG